jgi:hypothetical protein
VIFHIDYVAAGVAVQEMELDIAAGQDSEPYYIAVAVAVAGRVLDWQSGRIVGCIGL